MIFIVQLSQPRPVEFSTILPGSVIPDWIRHTSTTEEVNIELSPNWFNSNFLGFALSVVIDFSDMTHVSPDKMSFSIFPLLVTNSGQTITYCDANYHHTPGHALIEPVNMWLAYAPVFGPIKWHEVNHIKVTFLKLTRMPLKINRYGVGLMFSREDAK